MEGGQKILNRTGEILQNLTSDDQNVSQNERIVSAVVGTLLAGLAIQRFTKNSWFSGTLSMIAGSGFIHRALTGHCSVYKSLDINSNQPTHDQKTGVRESKGVKVEKSIMIEKPAEELFQYWKKLENLPNIMRHLKSVEKKTGNKSHWVAKAPAGLSVEWDAEIINERENELIAWKSIEGSQVDNAGSVRFYPGEGGQATEVKVNLKYDPPGGKAGVLVAKLFGRDAATEIEEDLAQFKQMMESGKRVEE